MKIALTVDSSSAVRVVCRQFQRRHTNTWTTLAANTTPRLYHSIALLMNDGAIFVGGGGAPGPVKNENAEIFRPPYLFNDDGSRAAQMSVSGAPGALRHGQDFGFDVNGSVDRVTMIKVNNVTHSVNTQIFQELDFTQNGNRVSAVAPRNANVATPGLYQLLALDANGVPSQAAMVWMEPGDDTPRPPPPTPPVDGEFNAQYFVTGAVSSSSQVDFVRRRLLVGRCRRFSRVVGRSGLVARRTTLLLGTRGR